MQNILTLVQETFSFASWPSLQAEKHEVYLQQWRNPNASIAYETSPNILIAITFTMSVLPITEFYFEKTLTDNLYALRILFLQRRELALLLLEPDALCVDLGNREPGPEERKVRRWHEICRLHSPCFPGNSYQSAACEGYPDTSSDH